MISFQFDASKPIVGQASIKIKKPVNEVFAFVGEHFFHNYPKWALEITEFEPLSGTTVFVGAKARQIRNEHGQNEESIFEITDFNPHNKLAFKGVDAPYQDTYLIEMTELNDETLLTFIFELTEIDLLMRPFQKLIRAAIEEGAENTIDNINALILATPSEQSPLLN